MKPMQDEMGWNWYNGSELPLSNRMKRSRLPSDGRASDLRPLARNLMVVSFRTLQERNNRESPSFASQSATVSSTTCFSGVPSADRVIRSLSLPPFTSPLRTRFSISRCDVTPTCFRKLRIAILKRSSSNSAMMAVLPDQAGKD